MKMLDGIIYCVNLNLSICSRVGSRSPVTFKTILWNSQNSLQLLPIFFYYKELRCCIGFELNIVAWSTKILKGIGGTSRSSATLGNMKNSPWCPKNTFPEVFCIALSFLHLIWNGPNGVYWHRSWLCSKFLCSIFLCSKDTQPFDFIKPNEIWKLPNKVQYISHINGSLILFFGNLRIKFFLISWLNCEQYGKN